jgi:predicted  nucleic acid-binding Zn-ribbon protein
VSLGQDMLDAERERAIWGQPKSGFPAIDKQGLKPGEMASVIVPPKATPGYDKNGRPIDRCYCDARFMDAESYRDHLPCPAVKWDTPNPTPEQVTIAGLRKLVDAGRKEIENLKAALKDLVRKCQETDVRAVMAENNVSELRQQLADAEARCDTAIGQAFDLLSKYKTAASDAEKYHAELIILRPLRQQLEDSDQRAESLELELRQCQTNLREANIELQNLRKQLKQELPEIKTRLAALEKIQRLAAALEDETRIPATKVFEAARRNAIPVKDLLYEKCVHTEHCCQRHGCKYSDKDCPVAQGRKPQSFPCEECDCERGTCTHIDCL